MKSAVRYNPSAAVILILQPIPEYRDERQICGRHRVVAEPIGRDPGQNSEDYREHEVDALPRQGMTQR